MRTQDALRESIIVRLRALLMDVWDEHPAAEALDSDASLLSLGVDSLTLVSLLDRIEAEFHPRWDPDDPPGAFSSLRSLACAAAPSTPER